MREQVHRTAAIKLIARAREAVCEPEQLHELRDNYGASTVYEAVASAYCGVTNGYLSQICETISGRRLEVVGEAEARFPCPCCGRRTLTELYDPMQGTGYDICDYCGWEDDGTSSDTAVSTVNRGSMQDYRERIRNETNYYYQEKWSV